MASFSGFGVAYAAYGSVRFTSPLIYAAYDILGTEKEFVLKLIYMFRVFFGGDRDLMVIFCSIFFLLTYFIDSMVVVS